jgi:HlyD family secretion protein
VAGNLKRLEVHAGDAVKAGDLLAEVEWPQVWMVRSPVAGHVLRVRRESGGPIERGEVILEVADPGSLEIVAEVLTDDAMQIQAGAQVRIESWGGCQPLMGKVRLVEPGAFTKVSALGIEEQRVNVIIDITSPRESCRRLADGFRVNNFISVFQMENALVLPTGALFRDGEAWAVFRVVNGRAEKVRVEIPRHNSQIALVASGIKEGEAVILYPSDKIKEGTRVGPVE